jgi:hypothetical protein
MANGKCKLKKMVATAFEQGKKALQCTTNGRIIPIVNGRCTDKSCSCKR